MEDIAAEAGLSLGSTYLHFLTKDELLRAAIDTSLVQFESVFKAADDEADDNLRAYFREVLTVVDGSHIASSYVNHHRGRDPTRARWYFRQRAGTHRHRELYRCACRRLSLPANGTHVCFELEIRKYRHIGNSSHAAVPVQPQFATPAALVRVLAIHARE